MVEKSLLYAICRKALWGIVCVCSLLMFVMNFVYTSSVAYDSEAVTIVLDIGTSIIMLIIIGTVGVGFLRYRERVANWDANRVFAVLSAVYVVLGCYMVFNVDDLLRDDASKIYWAAMASRSGDYSEFQVGGYLSHFPRQMGMVLWDRLLAGISETPRMNFLTNLVLVLGINYVWGKVSWELFKNKLVHNVTLILCFAFLPQLFFILFAYGLIPGYFFLTFAFWQVFKFVSSRKYRHLIGVIVGVSVSVLLKQNNMIGVLAIIVYLTMNLMKDRKWQFAGAIILVFAAMILPGSMIESYYAKKANVEFDNSVPAIVWLSMGTDIDNYGTDNYAPRGPGWYDDSPVILHKETNFQTEKTAEIAKQRLLSNISKIKDEPGRALKFFWHKAISQWCDPMYQSVWSGPLVFGGQYTHTEILQSIYTGGIVEDVIETYGKGFNLALWGLAVLFLFIYAKNIQGWEMIFTCFVGGFLYHMACEAKSQYVYIYVFGMIPFAAYVLCNLGQKWHNIRRKNIGVVE